MADRTLRVGALYPDLLNIYADRGNLLLLERRCAWRGIGFELRGIGLGDALDPDAHDLLYIGGGQDRDQALCARDMAETKREALHAAADAGRRGVRGLRRLPAARPRLRHGRRAAPGRRPRRSRDRARGRPAADRQRRDRARPPASCRRDGRVDARSLAGFENHGGRTRLGPGAEPLGRVLRGHGNDGRSGFEGVRGGPHGTVVGTYLHGPLLPKNAHFADWLTATALGLAPAQLEPLDDALEAAAHAAARRAAGL